VSELISVVVPVHNGERFLAAALDSIAAQTHPAVETIVVDDGSIDESRSIVRGRSGVRLLTQEHQGVAAARNRGVQASRGDFLAFLDQDDIWYPEKLEVQRIHLHDHPEVDVVLGRQEPLLEPGVDTPYFLAPDQVYGDLGGVLPPTGLFRREAFDRVGLFDEDVPGEDDFDWLARAREAGLGIAVLDRIVMQRRIHDANQSRSVDLRQAALDVITRIVARRRSEGR
jgi:glycosyltransferase involved in cell wall biosynthesis